MSELEKLSHIHNINYSERYQLNFDSEEIKQLVNGLWRKYPKGLVANVSKGNVPGYISGLARYLAKYVASPPIAVNDACIEGIRNRALAVVRIIKEIVQDLIVQPNNQLGPELKKIIKTYLPKDLSDFQLHKGYNDLPEVKESCDSALINRFRDQFFNYQLRKSPDLPQPDNLGNLN